MSKQARRHQGILLLTSILLAALAGLLLYRQFGELAVAEAAVLVLGVEAVRISAGLRQDGGDSTGSAA